MIKTTLLVLVLMLIMLSSCTQMDKSLRIGIIKPSIDHVPLSYALDKGWLKAEQFVTIPFSSGWEVQEALIAGRIDVAIMPFTYVWNSVAKGYPLKTVSFFERETDAILVQPELEFPADLNGKKVALLKGSTLEILWQDYALRERIVAKPVYFRSPNEIVAALQSKAVDAAVLYAPIVNKLSDQYLVLHWFGENFPAHPCCDLAANTKQVTGPKLKLLQELYKGLEVAIKNMDSEASDVHRFVMANYGLTDAQAWEALQHTVFQLGLQQGGQVFQARMADISLDMGYLDKVPALSDVYWDINAR